MYQIYADGDLIYDSTSNEYKIAKGSGTLDVGKTGAFTFALYPEHPYFNKIIKHKTVILVKKSGRILFRGRAINDTENLWRQKVITCEGEKGFLVDSIVRPYSYSGTVDGLFYDFVNSHNAQVDAFKQFRLGNVTVIDNNGYIARENSSYENTLSNLSSRLPGSSLGGYIHVTHGVDGTEEVPTIHYLSDFTEVASQNIEFGSNLKDFVKKTDAAPVATAVIPLGALLEDGSGKRLTIESVNNGIDFIYDAAAVVAYGWIYKTVEFDDVTDPANLFAKGKAYLSEVIKEAITVQLSAIDLHLLDRSIDSFRCCEYVRCISTPHNFAETMLCSRQTFDLLNPQNDTITLGYSCATFAQSSANNSAKISSATSAANSAQASADLARSEFVRLNTKTEEYRIAEQRLTTLMTQSFGVFKTSEILEDGSTIFYMHDKPSLAESQNIWKMTGDVFAVSSDGGVSWSAGLDVSGNAIMNILSVIGIDATWINVDNLSAISANLGGWLIGEEGIYRECIDPSNSSLIYRVNIKTPESQNQAFLATNPIIICEKSIDGGKIFTPTCKIVADGTIYTGDPSNNDGAVFSASTLRLYTPNGRMYLDYDGLTFYDRNNNRKGMISPFISGGNIEIRLDGVDGRQLIVDPSGLFFISNGEMLGRLDTTSGKLELVN